MTEDAEGRPVEEPAPAMEEARRRWEQSAFRSGMLFILLPVLLIPVVTLTMRHWSSESPFAVLAAATGWSIAVVVSVVYGWSRIRRYKRDHPFQTSSRNAGSENARH